MTRSVGFWVNSAIALTFVVVGVFGVVSYRNTTGLVEISERVAQTHGVLKDLESLLSILIDAETAQRGYVLTGIESYLDPYRQSEKDVDEAVKELRAQFASSPSQKDKFAVLERVVGRKMDKVRRTIVARREKGFEAARDIALTGEGLMLMNDARKIVADLEAEENRLLEVRRREVDENANNTHRAIIAGHVIVFALLTMAGLAIRDERSRRDEAERSRRLSEQKIREQATFLDKIRDAIVVCDMDGKIVYWNRAAETLYGWTVDEAVGAHANQLLGENTNTNTGLMGQELLTQGAWSGEIQHHTKSGQKIDVEQRRTLIRDDQGQPQKQFIINIDITERKEHEARALRRQRLESIGTLAGGIAHDLNNVLAPILLGSELLAERSKGSNTVGLLSTIRTSAERGAEMVQQLLAFAGGMEGEHSTISLARVVEEVHSIMKHTFPKSIQVEIVLPSDSWMLVGDATGLSQVLLNLCVNARDAMPNGGKLIIRLENVVYHSNSMPVELGGAPGRYIVLTVEDSGHGIATHVIDKIFDPFFTTKEFGHGTGLGLSTSLGIVKSHGGVMTVHSVANVGSKFTIYLPATEAKDSDTSPSSVRLTEGHGEVVLLVDDELPMLEMVGATLESHGYRVQRFSDGNAAVRFAGENPGSIALAIIDMMMPIIDGPTTMQRLQAVLPEIRIIATSGLRLSGRSAEATAAGAKFFLPKPFNDEQLLKAIHQVLHSEGFVGADTACD